MKIYFILNHDDKYYSQKGTYENDNLDLSDSINLIEDFNDKNTISLESLSNKKNINLLEISKTSNFKNLRRKFFNKTYVPKKLDKKMDLLTDCFIKMVDLEQINLGFFGNNLDNIPNDDPILVEPIIVERIVHDISKSNIPKEKKSKRGFIIVFSLGFMLGFYVNKYMKH